MRIRPSACLVFSSLALSCSGPPIPSLNFSVATPFVKSGSNAAGVCPQDAAALSSQASAIRVTVRQHSTDPTVRGALVCDSVFAKSAPATLALPAGKRFDLFAEAFSDSGQRVATGTLFDVDPKAAPTMRMFLPETFHCNPADKLHQPRAFHTATVLPNGQILVAGGLVPTSNASEGPAPAGDQLFADGSVEVFDPITETFTWVKDAITRRAFHQAIALPDDKSGKFQVLLLGGLTADSSKVPVVQSPMRPTPFRFEVPDTTMVRAAPAEIVTWDPAAKTLTKVAAMKLPASVFQGAASLVGGGVVLAGGESSLNGPTFDQSLIVAKDPLSPAMASMLSEPRVAPALGVTDAMGGLLIGGLTDGMSMTAPVAKLGFMAPASAVPATLTPSGVFPSTQFATVTAVDASHFLVSGGLQVGTVVDSKSAADPPLANAGLFLLENAGGAMVNVTPVSFGPSYDGADSTCVKTKRYRPAGWNAATLLPSGDRVLITGGTGRVLDPQCNDCDKDMSVQCVLDQTAIYDVAAKKVAASAQKMSIPRFGHTQSVLADGRVLILGGLTRRQTGPSGAVVFSTFAPKDIEEWSPVRATPPMGITLGNGQNLDPDDPVYLDLVAGGTLSRDATVSVVAGKVAAGAQFYSGRDSSKVPALPCGGLM